MSTDGSIQVSGVGQSADTVAHRGALGSALHVLKEPVALGGIVPELMTQNTQEAWRVAETPRDFAGGGFLDETGPQGFILSMKRFFGAEEELLLSGYRYCITSSDSHAYIVPYLHSAVNRLCSEYHADPIYCLFHDDLSREEGRHASDRKRQGNASGITHNCTCVLVMTNDAKSSEGTDGLAAPSKRRVLAVCQYRGNRG